MASCFSNVCVRMRVAICTFVVITVLVFPVLRVNYGSCASANTLADAISTVSGSIDWTSTDYRVVHTGIIFNKVNPLQYENAMQSYSGTGNTVAMLNLRSLADVDEFYSGI